MQDNYDNEMIFSYMCTNNVMYNPIYGPKNIAIKYNNNGKLYEYLFWPSRQGILRLLLCSLYYYRNNLCDQSYFRCDIHGDAL